MASHFTSEFFAGNRARLRQVFQGKAPIVISANGLLQRGGDSSFPFVQDANFWYLTGIDEPDLVLVLDQGSEYLIVPGRSASREAFDGSVDNSALTERSGLKTVYDDQAGWEVLGKRLKKVKHLATVAPAGAYIEHFGLYTNPARATVLQKMQSYNESFEIVDLGLELARLRMVKQAPELAAIRQAIDITLATIQDVVKPAKLAKYRHEYEIEADISQGFRKRGAAGHSFEPIVAGGAHAVTLHNVANNGPLEAQDLLIMDIGAEVEHYAADITRTVSLSQPTERQKAVHAAVYDVQQYAMGLLKPGVLLHDYEEQIEHYMGQTLQALGLIQEPTHDNIRHYYPHATSH